MKVELAEMQQKVASHEGLQVPEEQKKPAEAKIENMLKGKQKW